MAAEERVYPVKKNLIAVYILATLAVFAMIIAVVTFVMYGRARMKEQEENEKLFLRMHYTSLFILLLLGVVYMFFMIETQT